MGHRDGPDALGVQKSLLPLAVIKPLLLGCSAHCLVTMLGEETV